MARNLEKTVSLVRNGRECSVVPEYDIPGGDIMKLMEKAQAGEAYDAIMAAFNYGYVLGHRATVAGKYRELKKKDISKADIYDKHKKERA